MKGSKIEWTDHTFNPWWGCTKVSPGCANCYAETFAKRTGNSVWGAAAPRRFFGDKHWAEPLKWDREAEREGVRRRVFCASMADVFEIHPDEEVEANLYGSRQRLGRLIRETPHLDWLLLTKRPENGLDCLGQMNLLGAVQPNVWVGATAENQEQFIRRTTMLIEIPAAVRFLSVEPMLGRIEGIRWASGGPYLPGDPVHDLSPYEDAPGRIHWVICGGESGHKARPMHPDWARSLRDQCAAAGVPFFFKQWGEWAPEPPAWDGVRTKILYRGLDDEHWVYKVGKKAAGRLLDGVEHNGFPVTTAHGSRLTVHEIEARP